MAAVRWAITILFWLPCACCVASVCLWIRSYYQADTIWKQRLSIGNKQFHRWMVRADSFRGRFGIEIEYVHFWEHWRLLAPDFGASVKNPREWSAIKRRAQLQKDQAAAAYQRILAEESWAPPHGWIHGSTTGVPPTAPVRPWKLDFQSKNDFDSRLRRFELGASHWMITAIAAAAVVFFWILRSRLRRRFEPGHCQTCGYDLRGTPLKCPECGTVVS